MLLHFWGRLQRSCGGIPAQLLLQFRCSSLLPVTAPLQHPLSTPLQRYSCPCSSVTAVLLPLQSLQLRCRSRIVTAQDVLLLAGAPETL